MLLMPERRHPSSLPSSPLEELEDLYRYTPAGLCVVDRDLRFVRVNDAYAEIVGQTPGDLLGRTMDDVLHESVRHGAVAAVTRVLETGEPVLDFELRRADPADPALERIFLVNVHPVRGSDGVTGAMAVLQNITSVRRAEETARDRLNELESIYRNSPVGLAFVDRDLRYLRVNQGMADFNGVSIEEMVGRTYRDLSPATADTAEPFLRGLMARGKSVHGREVRSRPPSDPNVEHIYLLSMDMVRDGQGEVIGHVSAVQDVSEYRDEQETAARRLQELEILYAHTPLGLCYTDTELRIAHRNEHFARLCTVPAAEQLGAWLPDVISEEISRLLLPHIRHAAAGTSTIDIELRAPLPGSDPRVHTWLAHTHPVTSASGEEVEGIITVLQDISPLADRQREIEAVRDRLAEAQRVARVGSWEWNIVEDQVWWSQQMYEIFREPPSYELSSASLYEHVHPEDRERLRAQVDQTLADDAPYHLSLRIVRGDGSEGQLFSAARLERADDGTPARLVGICQDVTELSPLDGVR